ncbi:MAG: TraB/GumN family protein [Candidatus Sulfobium sp.]|jgi:uncharacterized protein YbaP (TraB family)
MKRSIAALSIFLIFTLPGVSRGASGKEGKSFIWKVRSATGTAYLLGSVHLMKKSIYPLNREIENAFRMSDVLVVEANIENISLAEAGKIAEKSLYPPGDSLRDHLSDKTYDMVKGEAARMGLPVEILDTQRPWFLAMTFTSFEMMRSGFGPRYGIDRHFLSEAKGRKKIVELESLDYQVNLLSHLSESEQKLLLMYTLKDLRRLGAETDKMLHAWKTGDGEEMASLLSEDTGKDKKLSSFYEDLLYGRNRNMAAKIERFLRTGKTWFVVVGAGHLVGKKGIVEILKEKGYRVKQL